MNLKNNKGYLKNAVSKVLVLGLVGAMTLGVTSCGDTSWALKIDGEKLPAGVYLINQSAALQEAMKHEDYDSSLKNKWDNKIDDKSLEEWVNDEAEVLTKRYVQVEKMFEEKGLKLTEQQLENIEYNVEGFWPYISKTYEELGVSKESYSKVMTNSAKETSLLNAIYGPEGEKALSDDELKKYYEENYRKVNIASYSTVDSTTGEALADDKKKEMEDKANEDLSRLQNGENIKTIIAERKEATGTSTEETTEVTEESTQVEIYKDGGNSISDDLTKQIFEKAVVGQPILLSDDKGYYIVMSYDNKLSDESFKERKENILYQYKYDEFIKDIDEQAKSLSVEENKNALNTFKAKKWDK